MNIEGPQNQENNVQKPLEGEAVKNPDAIKAAHVESVSTGTSWPTKEGLKDSEIKEAMMKYFESLSEDEANDFAEQLYNIRRDLAENNRPGVIEKIARSIKQAGLPPMSPAFFINTLSDALRGLTRNNAEIRNNAFKQAHGHLVEMQKLLSKTEGNESLHPGYE